MAVLRTAQTPQGTQVVVQQFHEAIGVVVPVEHASDLAILVLFDPSSVA